MSATIAPADGYEMIEAVDDSLEAFHAAYETRGWGDGLPMIPPTEARVEAMLAAEPGDPEEVLGILPPRNGVATRRIVAVNAVLAGCPPRVFPVLTAAIRVLCLPQLNMAAAQTTTGPASAMVIVHGEAVERLGYNCGHGLFGPGNVANATTGRAVRLTLIHVGGAKPGIGSKKTQGQPSHYTYCFAENAPASPWEPYAHTVGVTTPSAITVGTQEGPHNAQDHFSEEATGILTSLASSISNLGSNTAYSQTTECFVVLGPEHAATIAGSGWSRQDAQMFLYERCRLRADDLGARSPTGSMPNPTSRPWRLARDPDDMIPVLHSPDRYRILVAGGAGKHSAILHSSSWPTMTVPLELPPAL